MALMFQLAFHPNIVDQVCVRVVSDVTIVQIRGEDPDPDSVTLWIQIRIRIGNPDPGQEN
jgi:hypothetical protein